METAPAGQESGGLWFLPHPHRTCGSDPPNLLPPILQIGRLRGRVICRLRRWRNAARRRRSMPRIRPCSVWRSSARSATWERTPTPDSTWISTSIWLRRIGARSRRNRLPRVTRSHSGGVSPVHSVLRSPCARQVFATPQGFAKRHRDPAHAPNSAMWGLACLRGERDGVWFPRQNTRGTIATRRHWSRGSGPRRQDQEGRLPIRSDCHAKNPANPCRARCRGILHRL